jgi:hypothetical protein
MIRPATADDIPALLEMGERFSEKARLIESVGYVADDMRQAFEALIAGGHPVFIGEQGAIGGTSNPHPFNRAHIMGQEMFWWSEGREGIALFRAFDAWCSENCHSLRMITLDAVHPERMGRLYERFGMKLLEHSYVKVY